MILILDRIVEYQKLGMEEFYLPNATYPIGGYKTRNNFDSGVDKNRLYVGTVVEITYYRELRKRRLFTGNFFYTLCGLDKSRLWGM